MKKGPEFYDIRKALDEEVFSPHKHRSQKTLIMNKVNRKKNRLKAPIFSGFVALFAVIIFTIITTPHFMEGLNKNTGIEKKPEYPQHTPAPENKNEEEPEISTEKTVEEWLLYFKELYKEKDWNFNKLNLSYSSEDFGDVHDKRLMEVSMEFKGGKLKYKSTFVHEHKDYVGHTDTYIYGKEVTEVFHHQKKFNKIQLDKPAEELRHDPNNDYSQTLNPLSIQKEIVDRLHHNLDKYGWTLKDINEQEKTVIIYWNNERGLAYEYSIQYETGNIVRETCFSNGKKSSEYLFNIFEIDHQVKNLDFVFSIPKGYRDIEEESRERIILKQEWFDQALNETDNSSIIDHISHYSEGSYLNILVRIKDESTEAQGKKAAEEFLANFTDIVNSSKELKQRNISIWDEGQYGGELLFQINDRIFRAIITEGETLQFTEDG